MIALRCFKKKGPYGRCLIVVFIVFILSQVLVTMTPTMSFNGEVSADNLNRLESDPQHNMDILTKEATDPDLINYVRSKLIERSSHGFYNLTNYWAEDQSPDQSRKIDNYLKKWTNGTFIDIGANDGEKNSITLFFERWRNWSGLLIEPDPIKYSQIKQKGRRVSSINACLRTSDTRPVRMFSGEKIPCLWITTLLYSQNLNTIDLLNIDVSGQESNILESIPYGKFYIRVITVASSIDMLPKLPIMYKYMDGNGFRALHQYVNTIENKTNILFINKENKLAQTVS